MPRKSRASFEVPSAPVVAPEQRLSPPAGLSARERELWRDTVAALPRGYLDAAQTHTLAGYVAHVAAAETLAERLRSLDVEDEAWHRLDRARTTHTKAALAHARALRLTAQSRLEPDRAQRLRQGATLAPADPVAALLELHHAH